MPGYVSYYVARVTAILHGSMKPQEIRRNMAISEANGYMAQWLMQEGNEVEHCKSVARVEKRDRTK